MNLEKQYTQALKALKQRIKYYEKLGYKFELEKLVPDRPKKITSGSIRRLQAITGEKIKSKAINDVSTIKTPKANKPKAKPEKKKNKPKKPKKTQKKEAKKKRSDHYKGSKKKKGTGKPPSELSETIINTAQSFDTSVEFVVSEEDYDNANVLSFLEDQITKLQNFVPSDAWSKNLQSLKQQDVNKALEIIAEAVDKHGAQKIAKIIKENAGAITELIESIMWRYSAIAFIDGRNAVEADLVRLESLLNSGDVSFADTQATSASMEENEWYSGILE